MRTKKPKFYMYHKKKKLYEVRKTIKGVFHSFGYYHTEMEAQFLVEGLKKADWNPDNLTGDYKDFWITKITDDPLKYVHRKKYDWSIEKKIGEGYVHFYSCISLVECLMVRDLLIANDWDKDCIPYKKPTATNEPYIFPVTNGEGYYIQKSIDGKDTYFNCFRTLEDAIHERNLLVKYDWDVELVCENEDEINDEGLQWLEGKYCKKNQVYKFPNGRIDYDKNIY